MNEKYRLESIGYRISSRNPKIHGDMNNSTVKPCFTLRFRGRRWISPATEAIPVDLTSVALVVASFR